MTEQLVAESKGEERCAFFVKRKGRTCRMLAARGSVYCGEHLGQGGPASEGGEFPSRRVPCPLDPKHTVFQHLLDRHLKKCNVTKKPIPTCFTANINSGLQQYEPSLEEQLPLSAFPPEQIEQLVAKVERIYADHCPAMEELVLEHPALACDLTDKRNGPSALKHIKQQASILGHLERLTLLSPNTCYMEFGAGRGKLSHCVQQALGASADVHYVLIDRANCRRKMDSYHKSEEQGPRFERLLMDIEHLDLGKLRCLESGYVERVVGISKHLCGAATDLTLRCLLETLPGSCDTNQPMRSSRDLTTCSGISPVARTPDESQRGPEAKLVSLPPARARLAAVLIALCCHQRCHWPQFVGRDFFEKLGLSALDFYLLCHMSSWAVCGVRPQPMGAGRAGRLAEDGSCCSVATEGHSSTGGGESSGCCSQVGSGNDSAALMESNTLGGSVAGLSMGRGGMGMDVSTQHPDVSREQCGMRLEPGMSTEHDDGMRMEHGGVSMEHGRGYIPHPKEAIGLKCKRLIDLGRVAYLEERGLDARLVYFVEKATSLENVMIIATPKISN